jgi:energy-coupling factor transport system substrate-specific component
VRRTTGRYRKQATPGQPGSRPFATLTVVVASLLGLLGFLWPFLLPFAAAGGESRAGQVAPFAVALITGLCLVAILGEFSAGEVRPARVVALLGVLVAINATLRLLPTFLGASPVFLLIILAGAVFGASIGFQLGALTMLVSSLLIGGFGPWLPYQMLTAGWVGLSAGLLPRLDGRPRLRLAVLAVFGAGWGLAYGALLNLSFWPFTAPGVDYDAGLSWVPGMSGLETLQTYARFYLITSLPHDLTRAVANAVLVVALGGPILRLLGRYRDRFTWQPFTEADEAENADRLPTRDGQPVGI